MENYKPEDTFNGEFSYLLSDEIGHSSNIRIEIRHRNIFFDRRKGMTFESIARKYGLTRERIRQICSKMMHKEDRIMFKCKIIFQNIIGNLKEEKRKRKFNSIHLG
jgi:hypothetical protein